LSFYACPDVPEQVAPLSRQNPRARLANGHGGWFDGSTVANVGPTLGKFDVEPLGGFGNIHRNPYHGPGTNNTNMILAKNFPFGGDGTRYIQVRMESDNVFNHTQFSLPTSTYGSSSFGQISGAASARQTQLAAKIVF
jgi:hypothetical protein